jgi:DNA invertase Pin-like site-specific DNA recombinase
MNQRVIIYSRSVPQNTRTKADILADLRQAVESRGDMVVAMFADDGQITGRGKYAGWRGLLATLDEVDQVVAADAGDLPGRTVQDLLKVLGTFRDHDVSLYLHREGIDTSSSSFATLEIAEAYRRAKLSAAIREGQLEARAAGRRIGRPPIPPGVLRRIRASLDEGLGIRATSRKLNVSAASVMTVARSMNTVAGAEEAA